MKLYSALSDCPGIQCGALEKKLYERKMKRLQERNAVILIKVGEKLQRLLFAFHERTPNMTKAHLI